MGNGERFRADCRQLFPICEPDHSYFRMAGHPPVTTILRFPKGIESRHIHALLFPVVDTHILFPSICK
jgi:hypothetical protein